MRITSLWLYPVKGCRGVRMTEVRLCDTGIVGDRGFLVVDDKGLFLTQRDVPELARIEPTLQGDALVLSADGREDLAVPLKAENGTREVQVFSSRGLATDAGNDAAKWLGGFLGRPVRLVRAGSAWQRSYVFGSEHRPLTFVDGYPMLLVSEASLTDLNGRLPEPVPMARFRPNIVVDGVPAYAEDNLDRAQCGKVVLRGVKPCTRCVVTTTDQTTGARDSRSEPLRTLARYRNDRVLRGAKFGMYVTAEPGETGRLAVGSFLDTALR